MIDLSMGAVSVAPITKALYLPTVNDCRASFAFFGAELQVRQLGNTWQGHSGSCWYLEFREPDPSFFRPITVTVLSRDRARFL